MSDREMRIKNGRLPTRCKTSLDGMYGVQYVDCKGKVLCN